MIPPHPPQPDPTPEVEERNPPPARQSEQTPFWSYQDFLLFLAFTFPLLIITVITVQALPFTRVYGKAFQGLLAQLIWYGLVFGALYLMLRLRYGQPFWRSLGWKFPFQGMALMLFGGPLLAVALGLIGVLLRTPQIQTPFQQMLNNRPTLVLFAIFAIIIGPLCEELAFRGFLMPLLVRSFGAVIGIIATGALFGLLHAPEYAWSWRHVLLITAAGSAFGWVKYKSGSTAASTTMHAAYNLTQFAAFLGQSR